MPDDPSRAAQAGSFGLAAAQYDQARPGYPEPAVDWLSPAGASRVVEVGAGTGQLTRQLVARGLDVVAVEPSTEMREILHDRLPEVRAVDGYAEDLPVDAGVADLVLVAQAWHWFDRQRAVAEIARVLRPGGQLGLVWNIRDERTPWVNDLSRLIRSYGSPETELDMGSEHPVVGAPFGAVERRDFPWTRRLDAAGLAALVGSRSSIITMAPSRREHLLAAVHQLALRQQTPSADGLDLPYVTRCSRTTLTDHRR